MPITYEYKDSIYWFHYSGHIVNSDLMETIEAFAAEEEKLAVVPHRISDLTTATEISVDFEDVLALAKMRRERHFPNRFKSAIVAANEVQMGFARMFQTLNTNPSIEIQIFHDVPAALAWITGSKGK